MNTNNAIGSDQPTASKDAKPAPFRSPKCLRDRAWRQFFCLAFETCATRREVLLAEWREFDMDKAIWHIPACHASKARMRAIPLTAAALTLLKDLRKSEPTVEVRLFPVLLKGDCPRETFEDCMVALGLTCDRFLELRALACERFAAMHPQFSASALARIFDRDTPIGQ